MEEKKRYRSEYVQRAIEALESYDAGDIGLDQVNYELEMFIEDESEHILAQEAEREEFRDLPRNFDDTPPEFERGEQASDAY